MRLWIGDEERAYVKSDKLLQFRSQKIHVFNHVFIHVFNHVFISTQALIIFIVIWLFFLGRKSESMREMVIVVLYICPVL